MTVGPGITGPPCQTSGGEAPSGLVGSHAGPEMDCACTTPANRPIFPGWEPQGLACELAPAAEPVVVSKPAAKMPKASSTNNFLIRSSPFTISRRAKYLSARRGGQVRTPTVPAADGRRDLEPFRGFRVIRTKQRGIIR